MDNSTIVIRGAREHNLRNVNLDLPRNQLIVFTGVSGSGKSSLAFDTLYAEGQRRYVESLSSYARQFLGQLQKPDVDYLAGLSPAISIQQKTAGTQSALDRRHHHRDSRLPARPVRPHRPGALSAVRPADHRPDARADSRSHPRAAGGHPLPRAGAGDPRPKGRIQGSVRGHAQARLRPGPRRRPGRPADRRPQARPPHQAQHRDRHRPVEDRVDSVRPRLAEAVEQALGLGDGSIIIAIEAEPGSAQTTDGATESEQGSSKPVPKRRKTKPAAKSSTIRSSSTPRSTLHATSTTRHSPPTTDLLLSAHYACTHCNKSYEPPSPQLFSFNSPHGMCPECDGLGTQLHLRSRPADPRSDHEFLRRRDPDRRADCATWAAGASTSTKAWPPRSAST